MTEVETSYKEEQLNKLKDAVQEMVNSFYRQQAESDLRKEIASMVEEELEISKRTFNKLARTAYQDSARKLNEETTEVLDLAEELGFYSHNEE